MLPPFTRATALTLHDTNLITVPHQGLWVGGAGNLKVTDMAGADVTISGIVAGTLIPMQVKRVWSTGSTASLVLALGRG